MNERILRRLVIFGLLCSGAALLAIAEIERNEGESTMRAKGFGGTSRASTFNAEENPKEFQNALITKYSIGGVLIFLAGATVYVWRDSPPLEKGAIQLQ